MKAKQLLFIPLLFISTPFFAQSTAPQLDKIKQIDLKNNLYELASDAFRGRRSGEIDEMRAAVWTAQKAREAGLKPAGEDGTFFQFFKLKRSRIAERSSLILNGKKLDLWKEIWPTNQVETAIEGNVVWLDKMPDSNADLKGKIVAMRIMPPTPMTQTWVSLWQFRYTAAAMSQQGRELLKHGVAAIIFVADDKVESLISFTGFHFEDGYYGIEGRSPATKDTVPVILASKNLEEALSKKEANFKADLKVDNFDYPSVNVIAKVEGTDAKLKKEYVLFSGHIDHDGVGPAVKGDSIWNGADDNGSVVVAMLAIGRAWSKQPAKRSALFVFHGSEERGLLGSRYFVAHPTVELSSIAAVLNGDMIGRNAPDSAGLLGITDHRNSDDLVATTLAANKSIANFKIDSSWDAATHPENWYFRSDHLPYAQAGVPAIFFTTLLHPDYHTPFDSADKIDYVKLTKMAKWIYETGWRVAESTKRPAISAQIKK
jgi:hypothetical protein